MFYNSSPSLSGSDDRIVIASFRDYLGGPGGLRATEEFGEEFEHPPRYEGGDQDRHRGGDRDQDGIGLSHGYPLSGF